MSQAWKWVENPAYAGLSPTPLEPDCHDRSHLVTIQCNCGEQMHFHETQVARVLADTAISSRCHGCGEMLLFPPGYIAAMFAEMRKRGWIR